MFHYGANLIYVYSFNFLHVRHIGQRPIYLCRAGETDAIHRAGRLNENGHKFREVICKYFYGVCTDFAVKRFEEGRALNALHQSSNMFMQSKMPKDGYVGKILCSTMPRAVETASATWEFMQIPTDVVSNLNPLDKGDFSGMEMEEIEGRDPAWYAKFENDPYNTRSVFLLEEFAFLLRLYIFILIDILVANVIMILSTA